MSPPIVLLVDDSPDLAAIVAVLGRRGGYAVEWRGDVPGAWAFLEQSRPDLVLLDVQLPGASGLELCRRARGTPRLAGLAVALFGHRSLTDNVAAGLEAGVDFLVDKELLGHPDAWQRRLAEILPPAHGQPLGRPLGWPTQDEFPPDPPEDWAERLRGALHHPTLRGFGPEVVRLLLRRAWQQAVPCGTGEGHPPWPPLPAPSLPGVVLHLLASLAEQVWRLLGSDASSPLREALAAASSRPPNPPQR